MQSRGPVRLTGPPPQEVGESCTRTGDLTLLPAAAGVSALVVAAEQENDAVTVGVAEDAQQDPVSRCGRARLRPGRAPLVQQRRLVFIEAELEEAVTDVPAVGAVAHADAVLGEDEPERRVQRSPLRGREALRHPASGRLVAVRRLVELQGETTFGHALECGCPVTRLTGLRWSLQVDAWQRRRDTLHRIARLQLSRALVDLSIHGIHPSMTRDSPTFAELWPILADRIGGGRWSPTA